MLLSNYISTAAAENTYFPYMQKKYVSNSPASGFILWQLIMLVMHQALVVNAGSKSSIQSS